MEEHVGLPELSKSLVRMFVVNLEHRMSLAGMRNLKKQHFASDLVYYFVCSLDCPNEIAFLSLWRKTVCEVILERVQEGQYEIIAVC